MPPFNRKKYQNWTNDELLQQYVAEEDYCAFYVLYERYEKRLWGMFQKRVNRSEDCKDLIQQTYEKLLKSKGLKTNSIEKYEQYLLGIAFNTLNQYYRHKNNPEYSYDFTETPMYPMGSYLKDGINEAEAVTEQEEKIGNLLEAIQQLSPKQQTAINLQLEQLNYEEIAQQMDTNVTNVGSLLNRAKEKLKKILRK